MRLRRLQNNNIVSRGLTVHIRVMGSSDGWEGDECIIVMPKLYNDNFVCTWQRDKVSCAL